MPLLTTVRPASARPTARPAAARPAAALAAGAGAAALAGLAVLALRRRLLVVRVDGGSMRPALEPGDRVLVSRVRAGGRIAVGDVVVFRVPGTPAGHEGRLIKRVAAVPGDPVPAVVAPAVDPAAAERVPARSLVVLGDARDSTDSRDWGYLPDSLVVGVMLRRIPRTRPPNSCAAEAP